MWVLEIRSGELTVQNQSRADEMAAAKAEAVKLDARSRCLASGIDIAKQLQADSRTAFLEGLSKMCVADAKNGIQQ